MLFRVRCGGGGGGHTVSQDHPELTIRWTTYTVLHIQSDTSARKHKKDPTRRNFDFRNIRKGTKVVTKPIIIFFFETNPLSTTKIFAISSTRKKIDMQMELGQRSRRSDKATGQKIKDSIPGR
jgi:hypothetical protein